ncbi:MAG TPA: hypothetical protein VF657_25760, partial [Actinoplanes sp.]
MSTRETLGRVPSFGAFQPTHTADQVAEAFRGHLPSDELAELASRVDKAADRRERNGKDPAGLRGLARLLRAASRPPTTGGPIELFYQMVGGNPLVVRLTNGDLVTQVPAGAEFFVPDDHPGQLFVRTAGRPGPAGLVLTGAWAGHTIQVTDEIAAAASAVQPHQGGLVGYR